MCTTYTSAETRPLHEKSSSAPFFACLQNLRGEHSFSNLNLQQRIETEKSLSQTRPTMKSHLSVGRWPNNWPVDHNNWNSQQETTRLPRCKGEEGGQIIFCSFHFVGLSICHRVHLPVFASACSLLEQNFYQWKLWWTTKSWKLNNVVQKLPHIDSAWTHHHPGKMP